MVVDQEVERTYWPKQIRSETGRPLKIEVKLVGKPLVMEHTGAGVSLVSEKTFQMILPIVTQRRLLERNCAHTRGSHSGGRQGGRGSAIPGATDKVTSDSC